ncbi:MAG: DoxX family protein [Cyclobacteriaceae bacterium]|nr:DoxX family protein [Cyclobacteriaceae bacterium SS2]
MRKYKIIFWIATGFLFLFEGIMPLSTLIFAPDVATAGASYLQYPVYFTYTLIAFKVLGAVALVTPKLPRQIKEWTYAGFTFNFICASISHFVVDGFVFVSFFPFIILGILVASYISYFKLHPEKTTITNMNSSAFGNKRNKTSLSYS